MSEFSISAGKRLIKNQGEKSVSEEASEELTHILERFAGDVAEESISLAEDDGLKTVKKEHIREALS